MKNEGGMLLPHSNKVLGAKPLTSCGPACLLSPCLL